nr:hypothetical protein Itr_chr12CG30870 [Ipomoea trifida]
MTAAVGPPLRLFKFGLRLGLLRAMVEILRAGFGLLRAVVGVFSRGLSFSLLLSFRECTFLWPPMAFPLLNCLPQKQKNGGFIMVSMHERKSKMI